MFISRPVRSLMSTLTVIQHCLVQRKYFLHESVSGCQASWLHTYR